MSLLSSGGAIAFNTVREALRNRLMYAIFAVSVLVTLGSVVISMLSYVEGTRIMQDFAFATMRMFTVGTAILLGINLLHHEVERRTLYTILSRPLSRTTFLLGKYAGLVATTWLMLLCMAVVFGAVSLAAGAPLHMGHVAATAMLAVEMAVVVSIAILFSSFTTPMLASLFTISIYAVGHLTQNLAALANASEDPFVRQLGSGLYQVLPDLALYDLSLQAVHGLAIPAGDLGWPVLYAVAYASVLLLAASGLFARRDLR